MNALAIANLMATKRCTYQGCKTRFPDGIIHLSGKYGVDLTWTPDAQYLFHYQDTHGFPHEMMLEELAKIVNGPMSQDEVDEYNRAMRQRRQPGHHSPSRPPGS